MFVLKYQLNKFILISLGASIGALIRWQVDNHFLVNLIGTLILGIVLGSKIKLPFQLLIGVGFCGALTTFSSWMIDCLDLLIIGHFPKAIIAIIFPLILGLISVYIGSLLGQKIRLIIFDLNNSFF